ncbi:aromatic acid exporter family protein [Streptomyces sp. NPDC017993]|uniref:FUSC family protein n=1 Tax=Streptomyces sp. NPDC017993 TaxID=3365027 RepID=UPI0037A55654
MVQSLKAAGAAIAAWALTGWWLTAPMALMAPWTALALVDATVYRSVRSGLQQLAVIVVGTLWASAAMAMTDGSTLPALLIALPVLVLVGTYRRLGAQGIYGSTTALFVITYGSYSLSELGHRLLETAIGAVIGITVNALVFPPVHLHNVREQLQRLPRESAELLHSVAEGLSKEWGASDAAGWLDRAHRIARVPHDVAEARRWRAESARLNPRWHLYARRTASPPPPPEADTSWERIIAHLMAIARTLAGTAGEQARLSPPGTEFLTRYAELAEHLAELCKARAHALGQGCDEQRAPVGGPVGQAEPAWQIYDQLVSDFPHQPGTAAAVSGSLLVETKQLLSELGDDR